MWVDPLNSHHHDARLSPTDIKKQTFLAAFLADKSAAEKSASQRLTNCVTHPSAQPGKPFTPGFDARTSPPFALLTHCSRNRGGPSKSQAIWSRHNINAFRNRRHSLGRHRLGKSGSRCPSRKTKSMRTSFHKKSKQNRVGLAPHAFVIEANTIFPKRGNETAIAGSFFPTVGEAPGPFVASPLPGLCFHEYLRQH